MNVFLDASAVTYLVGIDIDRTVIELATPLRARDGRRIPDAIQAAA